MATLNHYIDTARRARGGISDRRLSEQLGVSHGVVAHWRRGHILPSDDNMLALASLAGLPVGRALIDLNIWRTKGAVRAAYVALGDIPDKNSAPNAKRDGPPQIGEHLANS